MDMKKYRDYGKEERMCAHAHIGRRITKKKRKSKSKRIKQSASITKFQYMKY